MPGLFDEKPWWTTADLNNALARERDRKLPVRSSYFNALVPQVSAQEAAQNRADIEAQRGQPGVISKLLIGGAANAADAVGLPGVFDPDGTVRGQTWGNALRASSWIPQDIVDGAAQAVTAPARAYRGEISDEDMIAEGLNVAGNMAMGGSVVPKPANTAGMFGGRLAKTADHAKLATAEKMAAEGAPREAIWKDTGWFKGVDGKWRFEIDDSRSTFDAGPRGSKNNGLVDKMIEHPAMFDAYPASGDSLASWTVDPTLKGDSGIHKAFNYGADGKPRYSAIEVNAKTDAGGRSTALHELQHDIQMREGFARGGSLDEFTTRIGIPFTNSEFRIAQPHKYKRQAGEVEARAVEARRDLTPEQRASRPPWLDYDVPESQQIVRFGNGPSYSLDSDIARQIHEAKRLSNPEADPNRIAQIARRPTAEHPSFPDYKGTEWEVSSPVGNIVAYEHPKGVQIKGAGLDDGVPKGLGYGMPLYEALANEVSAAGKPLTSDMSVSQAAQRVYDGLERRGYDVRGPGIDAMYHPETGSVIDPYRPPYTVRAPNVTPREMPPPLPGDILYQNAKSAAPAGAADPTHVRSSLGFSGPSASELVNKAQTIDSTMRDLRNDLGDKVMTLLHKYGYDYDRAAKGANEWYKISPTNHDFIADKDALSSPGVREKAMSFADARKNLSVLEKQIDEASRGDRLANAYGNVRHPDEAMKVYHGTNEQFNTYDPAIARGKSAASADVGDDVAFVTPQRNFAKQFGDNVRELTLQSGNYFDTWNDVDLAAVAPFINGRSDAKRIWSKLDPDGGRQQNWGILEDKSFIDELRRLGYDGVRMAEDYYDASDAKRTAPSVAVFTRGKLTDAKTGDVFFANGGKSIAPGVLISSAGDQAPRVANPIRAYHGSPHDFDRFDMSRIGTGEGAQAYGHGLYFAENEGVAKSYRDGLGGWKWNGAESIPSRMVGEFDVAHDVRQALNYANGDPAKARAILERDAKAGLPGREDMDKAALDLFDEIAPNLQPKANGKMYEVNINAHPDDFLDWDKPLSQQSEKVRGAAEKVIKPQLEQRNYADRWQKKRQAINYADQGNHLLADKLMADYANFKPRVLDDVMPGEFLTSQTDSNALRDLGIPGIRYLDQGSRTAGEGSRNYVVFDQDLIDILRKYQNPQTAAAPGVLMVEGAKDGRR